MSNRNLTAGNISALVIGNALEWYDFFIYSFLTIYIARVFFPNVDATMSLLATTATFGVAFFMRPLGGLLIGLYADKCGRKAAISAVMAMMTVAMLLISLTPSYQQIGIAAPLLIVSARLLQGFSAGGEFCTSMAMLIELSPQNRRGYYGSWQMVGQILAMFVGSSMGLWLSTRFTAASIEAGAWRIPFLLGLLIAPTGLYIRRRLHEEPTQEPGDMSAPLYRLKALWRQILIAMGLIVGATVSIYVNISYIPTFMSTWYHLPIHQGFFSVSCAAVLMIGCIPLAGILSDRIGRKPVLLASVSTYLALIYPLFSWLLSTPDWQHLLLVESICCICLAAYYSVLVVIIAEIFPREVRSTGLGISYNAAVMIFGGTAQFVVTWMIQSFQTPFAMIWYLMAAMSITLLAALFYDQGSDIS
ncbi:MFS transporter [Legionella sp. CNM-4043-24]|uniref:MFS transporter n=1 Tax=Legionella sp. CNM-4043-24 TaxID=3421646 RepID=UPI00403AEA1C